MTTDTSIDDELDELDEDDDESQESPTLAALRRKFDKANARHAKETKALTEELAGVKRELLVRKAGLPDDLTDRQITALIAAIGDDETPEAVRQAAVDFKWAEPAEPATEDESTVGNVEAQARMSAAASGATTGRGGVLRPEDVQSWPVEKRQTFLKEHPDTWEQLKRGEQVATPPGF